MAPNGNVSFKITSMDSLGQGVSKESNKITFLAKTLPGDEGEAQILASRKGVQFGKAVKLTKSSELRVQPVCPHFEVCPSCHYLHTDYDSELRFKKESLEGMFYKMERPAIEVIPAVRRTEYRNRIQLHYDTTAMKFGMFDAKANKIVSVPSCLIGLTPLQEEIRRLYQNDQWLKDAPKSQTKGHVELYWKNEKLHVQWNKNYAEDGFSQVFAEMNALLVKELLQWNASLESGDLLDLFGGNGNLSNQMSFKSRLCVDLYQGVTKTDFISQELYADDAFKNISKQILKRDMKVTQVLLDPPRSGMKDLNIWLEGLKPRDVAYVSCDPHTLMRDLKTLMNYEIKKVVLLDFFPSTFHYETLVLLKRRE